jgi:predicted transcriptional regulator
MNAVIVSIHPEHVEKILSGDKKYEYRKVAPKRAITHIVIYCTAPVKRIVALVEVTACISGSPTSVWEATSSGAGIPRSHYRKYFHGHRHATAFRLGSVYKISEPLKYSELSSHKIVPQSFCYLNNVDFQMIRNWAKKSINA